MSNLLGITNTNAKQTQQQVLPSKPPRTIGSRIKRRRKSINESDSRGAFDALPNELVEAILLKLDAPALASLQATSKYFRHSGVCDRVARFILATRDGEPGFDECHRGENNKEEEEEEEVALNDESDDEENRRNNNNNNNNNKRKKRTKTTAKKMSMVPPTVGSCRVRPQDSAIAVLRFKDVMERAERASSLVSLGSLSYGSTRGGLCTVSVLEKMRMLSYHQSVPGVSRDRYRIVRKRIPWPAWKREEYV